MKLRIILGTLWTACLILLFAVVWAKGDCQRRCGDDYAIQSIPECLCVGVSPPKEDK